MQLRRRETAILALALGALGLLPARADAFCQTTNLPQSAAVGDACRELCNCPPQGVDDAAACTTPGGDAAVRIRWRRPCLEWALNDEGSMDLPFEDVRDIVLRAFEQWTTADCGGRTPGFMVQEGTPVRCDVAGFDQGGPNVNVIAFASGTEWEDRGYDAGALAITEAWFGTSSGEIFDADLTINEATRRVGGGRERSFLFVDCPEGGCAPVSDRRTHDLGNVVTHELGHFFGLAHTPEDEDATMWACAGPTRAGPSLFDVEIVKKDLASDDVAGICAIYGEGTLDASCDFTPRGGRTDACEPGLTNSGGSGGCGCDAGGGPAPTLLAAALVALVLRRRRRA